MLRRQNHLSGLTLVTKDGREFKAHRNVLSAASPFFFKLLQSDMKENRQGIVRFEEISRAVMEDVSFGRLLLRFTRKLGGYIIDIKGHRKCTEDDCRLFAGRVMAQEGVIYAFFLVHRISRRAVSVSGAPHGSFR